MFLSKLNSVRQSLTPSEKKAAEYILSHIEESKTITSKKLADITGTGQATMIRFSKKLGYQSFREMLSDLSATATKDIIEEELNTEESDEETLKKILLQIQDIAELTLKSNSNHEIEKAANLLKRASQIIVFGMESSNLYAKYLANQLTKMGFCCLTSDSADTTYLQIRNAPEGTVLFLVSETGQTNEVIKAARLAKDRKTLKIIAMTRRVKNPLHEYADILLKTVAFDTLTRLNITTMRTSQQYLIDAIYLLIMKSDFEYYNQLIEESSQITKK